MEYNSASIINKFEGQSVYLLAERGKGSTRALVDVVYNTIAYYGKPVVFFSSEITREEFEAMIMARDTAEIEKEFLTDKDFLHAGRGLSIKRLDQAFSRLQNMYLTCKLSFVKIPDKIDSIEDFLKIHCDGAALALIDSVSLLLGNPTENRIKTQETIAETLNSLGITNIRAMQIRSEFDITEFILKCNKHENLIFLQDKYSDARGREKVLTIYKKDDSSPISFEAEVKLGCCYFNFTTPSEESLDKLESVKHQECKNTTDITDMMKSVVESFCSDLVYNNTSKLRELDEEVKEKISSFGKGELRYSVLDVYSCILGTDLLIENWLSWKNNVEKLDEENAGLFTGPEIRINFLKTMRELTERINKEGENS